MHRPTLRSAGGAKAAAASSSATGPAACGTSWAPSAGPAAAGRPAGSQRPLRVLTIRPLTADDVPRTARWQMEELPRGFVASLGGRFVATLQRAFLKSPYGIGLAAVSPDRPEALLGFVLGSSDARRHAAHVVAHNRARLALLGLLGMLRRPALLPRFARRRAARYAQRLLRLPSPSRGTSAAAMAAPQKTSAVLSMLIVAPEGRGQGTGAALAEAFVAAATTAGSDDVALVTRADESGAAAFWKRLGWQEVDVHQNLDGDLVASFVRELR